MSSTFAKMRMAHDQDPAETITKEVGDLSQIDLFHNLILVGIYKRPEKTAGGIILTNKIQDEEIYQGTVGLVLKVGPNAFVDDAVNKFNGMNVKPGDWIVFRTSDTQKTSINGTICRLLEDAHVKMRVPSPDTIY